MNDMALKSLQIDVVRRSCREETRARLLPRFQRMKVEDVSVVKQHLGCSAMLMECAHCMESSPCFFSGRSRPSAEVLTTHLSTTS